MYNESLRKYVCNAEQNSTALKASYCYLIININLHKIEQSYGFSKIAVVRHGFFKKENFEFNFRTKTEVL